MIETLRKCKQCGISFIAKKAKFCPECIRLRNVERIRKRREEEKKSKKPLIKQCEMCRVEFIGTNNNSKYCDACKIEASREDQKRYRLYAKKTKNVKTNICIKCKSEYIKSSNRQRICEECRNAEKVKKPSGINPKFLIRGAITYSSGVSSIQGGGM